VHDVRRRLGAAALALACLLGGCEVGPDRIAEAKQLTGGDPERGRALTREYGCGACHTIDGVPGARALVGPPLNGLRERVYIAGVVPNSPQALVRWIVDPKRIDSLTAMPKLGLSEDQARDVAAFLYTLR
jgi:mono/diheme cytochrome c family protein